MTNISAKLSTGSVRLKIPSKQIISAQKNVIFGVSMKTNEERKIEHQSRLAHSQMIKEMVC